MMTKDELLAIKTEEPDMSVYALAKESFDSLAKPIDGFGYMEDIICRIASIRGRDCDISKKTLIVMCADNGVVEEGVSQTDQAVTAEVAALLGQGKSTVGVMCSGCGIKIIPVDIGIDTDDTIPGVIDKRIARGTKNITKTKAMTEEECLKAIGAGIDIAKECAQNGIGMIATGEMGIGNTTTSTALFCALTGRNATGVAGRGAGLSDAGLTKKINAIEDALLLHGLGVMTPTPSKTFEALCAVGGLDIAALAGVFIGCALHKIPVVIDGAISAVAALTASYIVPGCEDYMIASHKGRERITGEVLDILGLHAVIDADMALGEGTGAVMLFPMIDMVMNVFINGTRFSDTDILQYERFDG